MIAYQLAKKLEFFQAGTIDPIVPEAVMITIKGEKGVFIKFLDGYGEPGKREPFKNARASELKNFQLLAVFDFLIGNLDRHDDNFFVKKTDNGEDDYSKLKLIDHGNAFPFSSPNPITGNGRNMYKWARFSVAKVPFTEEIKRHILEHLNHKKLYRVFTTINQGVWWSFFSGENGKRALKYLESRRLFLTKKSGFVKK